MNLIRVDKGLLRGVIQIELNKMLNVCRSQIDATDIKTCENYIMEGLEKYRIKEKWEVM